MRSTSSIFLRAPAITLPDHREVYNAKCRRLQGGWGGGKPHADKSGQGEGLGKQVIFCERPL